MSDCSDRHLCLFRDRGELVPSGSRVGGREREAHLRTLRAAYAHARPPRHGFPGPNPVSIGRAQLPRLAAEPYLAALKTDGTRYALLLTTFEGEPRALMINRALDVYEVEIWANEAFFAAGTLFDGELVWESTAHEGLRLLYLVFDVVMLRGASCEGTPYRDRLMQIHRHILSDLPAGLEAGADGASAEQLEQLIIDEDKVFAVNNAHGLHIQPKRFVSLANLPALWASRGQSRHRNDGLVFLRDTSQITSGTDHTMYKFKEEHTIDVKFVGRADQSMPSQLLLLSKGVEVPGDEVLYDGATWAVAFQRNKLVQCLLEAEHRNDADLCGILECICRLDRARREVSLFPIKHRLDKPTPNDLAVVRATLQHIEEGVSFEELSSVCLAPSGAGTTADGPTADRSTDADAAPADDGPPTAGAPVQDALAAEPRAAPGAPSEVGTRVRGGSKRGRGAVDGSQPEPERPKPVPRSRRTATGPRVEPAAKQAEPAAEPAEPAPIRDVGVRTRSRGGASRETDEGVAPRRKRTR